MASKREKLEASLEIVRKKVPDTRYTISPVGGDHVYVRYVSGAEVWETPSVAERAIAKRLAVKITPKEAPSENKQ